MDRLTIKKTSPSNSPASPTHTSVFEESSKKPPRHGMPLSLLILRYFAYVLLSITFAGLLCFILFAALLVTGIIYPANYAETNLSSTEALIRSSETVDDSLIASSYYWAHYSSEGSILSEDMPSSYQDAFLSLIHPHTFSSLTSLDDAHSYYKDDMFYSLVKKEDGSAYLLSYRTLPQFASKALRDCLPNPQNIFLVLFGILSFLAIILIALRAARVLSHKMQALTQVAQNIEEQNLDFTTPSSNVREINTVLTSMEHMRTSLKTSLEAQWKSEQFQREQISALAHDLKTPLTIVKGNSDLLLESNLDEKQRSYLSSLSEGVVQLEAFTQTIIEFSRSTESPALHRRKVPTQEFLQQVTQEGAALARIAHLSLVTARDELPATLYIDPSLLKRALINLISNAIDYSAPESVVKLEARTQFSEENENLLVFTISDTGPGFSEEALARGTERFYQADPSRSSHHFGMGLSIASSLIALHGGTLTLKNAENPPGGAVVVVTIKI